ncbi:MAG: hypothetical protein JXQ75_13015 [Phycisphaerae bacterium]|nr:hypothetical protein [Phycisphaerae bacterium]
MDVRLTIHEPRMRPTLEAYGLRQYEDYLAPALGEAVGRSKTTQTRRIVLDGADGKDTFYLKIYRHEGSRRRHRFLRDKASIEARNYRTLSERCGVIVPDVIAHGCRRRGWRLLDAFILTRAVPRATPLDRYVRMRWPRLQAAVDDPMRHNLLEGTAELVSRMHARGFFHVDLQWRNLLVVDNGTDRPAFGIIDSARGGLRWWRVHREHGRLRDLSSLYKLGRLWLTRGEQVRWLRRYLGVRRLSAEHRLLIRTILYDRSIKGDGTA